jgi:hypothetical protein
VCDEIEIRGRDLSSELGRSRLLMLLSSPAGPLSDVTSRLFSMHLTRAVPLLTHFIINNLPESSHIIENNSAPPTLKHKPRQVTSLVDTS